MSRKELPVIAGLVALLVAWPYVDRWIVRNFYPERLAPVPAEGAAEDPALPSVEPAPVGSDPHAVLQPAADEPVPPADVIDPAAAVEPETAEAPAATPARTYVLRNARAEYTFTSHGAALVDARLLEYPRTIDSDSEPVLLDFSAAPALAWDGVPGLGADFDFEGEPAEDGRALRFERVTAGGLRFVRRIELDDAFLLRVRDELFNVRADGATVRIEAPRLRLGTMTNLPGESMTRGVAFLGIDTLSPGGEKVRYWGGKMAGFFKDEQKRSVSARPPPEVTRSLPDTGRPVDWAAVKSKYFVQILRPEGGADSVAATVRRTVSPQELQDPNFNPRVEISEVAASVAFPARAIEAGAEPAVREMEFYVGPKQFAELQKLAYHQANVMEFGMWGGIGKVLLRTLNGIHRVIPNYGVAIILLTIIIRIVFWPITHKGTQSMKRMQEIQPLVTELRARYKDNPQRQQKEIMALYKEHKVNPVGGCLPMLIQIPVFIALFVVLRSAIELRFASFLWVRDLSEPENLLAGMLPFGLSLNLLPLIMTVTQVWQQKLTPQAGDPSQQKMMAFMPVIMLIFFYNFASGLVLYWTTNQCLMIVQQLAQRRAAKKKNA